MEDHEHSTDGGERFNFGKNWTSFLDSLNDERMEAAQESLTGMLEIDTLNGKSFLDIGCGSGLFSLAAMQLGASRVHSFDYDPDSVQCAKELKRRFFPEASNWTIEKGDVLNEKYMHSLGTFNVVYSWGVLHHTGDMWKALEHATIPVGKPEGKLFIGIYNDCGRRSRYWLKVKEFYCRLPDSLKTPYILIFSLQLEGARMISNMSRGRLPWYHWKEYYRKRGMSYWHDIVDWIGGYPYQFAKPEELFDFYRARGYRLDRFLLSRGFGNNQMLFTRL